MAAGVVLSAKGEELWKTFREDQTLTNLLAVANELIQEATYARGYEVKIGETVLAYEEVFEKMRAALDSPLKTKKDLATRAIEAFSAVQEAEEPGELVEAFDEAWWAFCEHLTRPVDATRAAIAARIMENAQDAGLPPEALQALQAFQNMFVQT